MHASVSAVHARIARDHIGWYVHDLGSRNGTAVDSVVAAPLAYLRPGAQLRLGDVVLGFALRSRTPQAVTIESEDGRRFELCPGATLTPAISNANGTGKNCLIRMGIFFLGNPRGQGF